MENNPSIDYNELKSEVKVLKFLYVLHIVLYVLIIFSHILLFLRILWLSYTSMLLFFICSLIFAIGLVIPFIIFIFLIVKTIKKKLVRTFIIISKTLFYICIINTVVVITIIFLNSKSLHLFYEDCPFNFDIRDINEVFNNISDVNIQYKKCNNRRCLFNNYKIFEQFKYNYICNFYSKRKNDLNCSKLDTMNDVSEDLLNYVNICQDNTTFYKCSKSHGYYYYNITSDYSCPNYSEVVFGYLLGLFFFIIDMLGASATWLMEYYSYKKVIMILNGVRNRSRVTQNNPSQIETCNTSKIEEGNLQENNRNEEENQNENQIESKKDESFVKQETQTLIIDNGNNINNQNNLNMIIDKEQNKNINNDEGRNCSIKTDRINVSNKNVLANTKNGNINANNISSVSKSGNLLLNNNNDYFKEANIKAENRSEPSNSKDVEN